MARDHFDEDVKPLSEFRANVSRFIERVRKTKRPIVLTQRGHSAAVVLDVSAYEQLLEEVETLRDIHLAEKQLAQGKGAPQARARVRVTTAAVSSTISASAKCALSWAKCASGTSTGVFVIATA